ncbi:MAG: InlB B-repeat-containing protein [Eubacterium sp.]|nr:InlB B-repeat-containing protein [Eubacterium sp.]
MEQLRTRLKSLLVLILALMLMMEGTAIPVHADDGSGETEYLIVLQNISIAGTDLDGVEGATGAFAYDARFLAAYQSNNGKITQMIDGNQIDNSNVRSLAQGSDIDAVEKLENIQSEKGATVYVLTQVYSGLDIHITDQRGNSAGLPTVDGKSVNIYENAGDTKGSNVTHYFYKFEDVKSVLDAFITINPGKYNTGSMYDFNERQWIEANNKATTVPLNSVNDDDNKARAVVSADITAEFSLQLEFMDRKISLPPIIYLKPGESQKITANLTPPPEWDDPDHPENTYNWYRCYSDKTYNKWYKYGVPSWNEKTVPVTIDDYGNITAKSTAVNGDKCFVAATYKKNENIDAFCQVMIADASVTYFADPAGTEVLDSKAAENGKQLKDYPPAKQPEEKENYTFAGWSTEPNMTAYADKDNNVYEYVVNPETKVIDGHLSLYPIYVPDRLNVKLDFDGGSIPEAGNHELQDTDFFVNLNEKIAMKPLLNTTKDGYELAGWYTKDGLLWNGPDWKTLGYHDVDFDTVPEETVGWGVTPTYCDKDSSGKPIIQTNNARKFDYYTVTLTAKWNLIPEDIDVEYLYEGGTEASASVKVKMGDPLTLPPAPNSPDPTKRFAGWKDSNNGLHSAKETLDYNTWKEFVVSKKMTFTATFETIPTYSVSFDSDGGSHVDTQTVQQDGKATKPDPAPTKLGYTFDKWTLDGVEFDFDTPIGNAITLKAVWKVNQYTITFNTNGGDPITPDHIVADYGASVTMPTDVTREHYTFKGWDKEYTTMPAENVTVNALWEPKTYKLKLDPAGGTFESTGATDPIVIQDIYGAEIKAETPSRYGYDFTGWKKQNGEDSLPKYMPDTGEDGVTYVAQWKEKPVKVVPVLDGELTATSITVGDKLEKSTIRGTMKYDGEPVDGEFKWVDPDTQPTLSDSNKTEYDVIFIPDEDDKYESVPLKAKVEVKPGPEPKPIEDITYDDLTEEEKVNADKLTEAYGTDKDTAAKMLKTGEEYGVSMDTMLLTTEKLTNLPNDKDPKGTTFSKLRARAVKRTKTTMVLQWKKQTGADGYLIYTNRCGRYNKMKLKKTVKNPNTVKWNRKKLKKGKYYKYTVVAYKNVNGQKLPIAASCMVHCTTKAKSNTIAKGVKVNKTKVTLAAGKTFKIKAKEIKAEKGKVIRPHRVISYESSKPEVAKVEKKTGKVTAVAAGTTYIYAYAQDGVYKKIKITVK